MAEPAQCQLFQLADPLSGEVELFTYLLEGAGASVIDPVAQCHDAAFPFREPLDEPTEALCEARLFGDLAGFGGMAQLDFEALQHPAHHQQPVVDIHGNTDGVSFLGDGPGDGLRVNKVSLPSQRAVKALSPTGPIVGRRSPNHDIPGLPC